MFYTHFKRDVEAELSRIHSSGSQIANTVLGPIEYFSSGEGLPILWVHGVVGGFDHGPFISQAFVGRNFRIIAISRFGYLGTPLPRDASPAAQADLYAALLDELDIPKVTLIGTSAGGASSLQFGLRHPDRCAALVLWSMAVPPYEVPSAILRSIMGVFFGSNFAFWCMMTYTPGLMLSIMGVPRVVQKQLAPTDKGWVTTLMFSLLPMHLRVKGIMNDICVSNPDLNKGYPLGQLSVPTLVIHAVDDPMPPFTGAERMAGQVPNARFIQVEGGGHLLLGHHEKVRDEIMRFIRENELS